MPPLSFIYLCTQKSVKILNSSLILLTLPEYLREIFDPQFPFNKAVNERFRTLRQSPAKRLSIIPFIFYVTLNIISYYLLQQILEFFFMWLQKSTHENPSSARRKVGQEQQGHQQVGVHLKQIPGVKVILFGKIKILGWAQRTKILESQDLKVQQCGITSSQAFIFRDTSIEEQFCILHKTKMVEGSFGKNGLTVICKM